MAWVKQAKDWEEYRRLYRRWRMGFEHFEPKKPPRESRGGTVAGTSPSERREGTAAPPAPSPALDIEDMSFQDLRTLAKDRGINTYGMNKDEILDALTKPEE